MSDSDEWTSFADRLPAQADAPNTLVMIRMSVGHPARVVERSGMWNWIPPHREDAKALWAANGCIAWRRMRATDPIYDPEKPHA